MLVRFLLTAVLAAGCAFAQGGGADEGMPSGGGRGGGSRGGGGNDMGSGTSMQVRRQTRAEMLFDKLKLNKEQKDQAVTILSAAMEQAAPVRDQITRGRAVIANAITSKASEEDIKSLLGQFTAVNVKMTGIEAEAFGKLYALLKPNQQSKAPQAFELMAGMFAGGGMPGGGGGGGRDRGGENRGERRQ